MNQERYAWGVVMVGLVPTIQPSTGSSARGEVDPPDEPEDDSAAASWGRLT